MSDLENELVKIIDGSEENEKEEVDNKSEAGSVFSFGTEKSESDSDESEFEEIDVTDNPLYQVLSAFFETEEGENICDILKDLNESIRDNTKMMNKLLRTRK